MGYGWGGGDGGDGRSEIKIKSIKRNETLSTKC